MVQVGAFTTAESTLDSALPRCLLRPLSALAKLREKPCADVHDFARWRWLPSSPMHRLVIAARPHDLPESPMFSSFTIAESMSDRAFARCVRLPLSVLENLREKLCDDAHDLDTR